MQRSAIAAPGTPDCERRSRTYAPTALTRCQRDCGAALRVRMRGTETQRTPFALRSSADHKLCPDPTRPHRRTKTIVDARAEPATHDSHPPDSFTPHLTVCLRSVPLPLADWSAPRSVYHRRHRKCVRVTFISAGLPRGALRADRTPGIRGQQRRFALAALRLLAWVHSVQQQQRSCGPEENYWSAPGVGAAPDQLCEDSK